MINKNELRLGNWVKTEYKEIGNIKITEISESVIYSNKTKGISYSSLLPIQLTEEILLKCGFLKCNFTENHYDTKAMRIWKCNDMFLCDKNGVVIKSLHQLQNLYFALTNQELKIEL